MRLTLEKATLSRALTTVTKVVEHRNTIPILGNVLLSADGGQFTIKGTDLDIEVSSTIAAEAEADGTCTVDAKLLASIVSKAAGDISLALEGVSLTVKSGRYRSTLQTLPADDFPSMDAGEFAAEFDTDLADLFAPVAFAMSDEATRFYLCGVYLEPSAVTATNGHKLSTVAREPIGVFTPVIVPAKTVNLAPKGRSRVRISGTKIQFISDSCTITSRVIEGTFPDYQRVIPSNNDKLIVVDNDALRKAAERVAVVSTEKSPGVKLDIANGEIILTIRGGNDAVDVVPCDYDGEPLLVGFAANYMAEVLSALPAGNVTMALEHGGSPVVFTSEAAEGQRIVLMPRRV